jgi:hypothetical protein
MMTMVISGSDGVTFPDSTNQFSGGAFSFKNRLINGDMRIDQRNAGAAVTTAGYTLDRFTIANSTDGAFSAQQDSSAPTGFVNSLKVTATTADGTLTTTQNLSLLQPIEGTNVSDLAWGTANAKTVTLSFWVRSSLTGTFGGALRNSGLNRSYPFTYSISVADTWEYKTVTVAGDTSGTWLTTTGVGIGVLFGLGAGPDRSGTAGAWNSNNNVSATGAVSVIGTLNATWFITGVQLEVGSVATPFERRPFGTELQLCQRYYWVYTSNNSYIGMLQAYASSAVYGVLVNIPVTMRATPSVSQSGNFNGYRANSDNAGLATTIGGLGTNGQNIETNGWGGGSGLTAGHAVVFQGATGAKLIASAEL